MNYYAARELMDENGKATGKWHYTVKNDNQVWAVGNCSKIKSCPDCKGRAGMFDEITCEKCSNKGIIYLENPCPGHDTPEEACEHYKEYLIEHATFMGPKQEEWPKDKCKMCNSEALYVANVDWGAYYMLCEKHANKETLKEIVSVGEIWSS